MPVIYPKNIRRKFQSLNLELIKESLAEEGYDFIRDGGFTENDKPFKFCNYLFYEHPKSKTRIRVGYDYPSILSKKNLVFEICYAKQGDGWWTDIVPDFRKKKWRKISEWYNKSKSIKKCTKKLKTVETAKELDEKFKESFNESLSKAFAEYRESGSFTVDSLEDNPMELAFAKGYLAGFIDLEKKMMANVLGELKKFNGASAYVKQDINYAELYGVHPGEKDFTGAIERSLKKGVQHFGPEMHKLREKIL